MPFLNSPSSPPCAPDPASSDSALAIVAKSSPATSRFRIACAFASASSSVNSGLPATACMGAPFDANQNVPGFENFVFALVFVVIFLHRRVIHFDVLLEAQEHRLGKQILVLELEFIPQLGVLIELLFFGFLRKHLHLRQSVRRKTASLPRARYCRYCSGTALIISSNCASVIFSSPIVRTTLSGSGGGAGAGAATGAGFLGMAAGA